MSIFSDFSNRCADYDISKLAFQAAQKTAGDIIESAKTRINQERAQTAERIEALEAQQNDPDRSDTVRKISGLQLEQLRARSFTPSEEELSAFGESVDEMHAIEREMSGLRSQIHDMLDGVAEEVQRMRSETVGDSCANLYARWIDGIEKDFEVLRKHG